jgi:hypothetical protein
MCASLEVAFFLEDSKKHSNQERSRAWVQGYRLLAEANARTLDNLSQPGNLSTHVAPAVLRESPHFPVL